MSDWIEKHSINCTICGNLADERDCIQMWDEGAVCLKCQESSIYGTNDLEICEDCEKYFHQEDEHDILCPACQKINTDIFK